MGDRTQYRIISAAVFLLISSSCALHEPGAQSVGSVRSASDTNAFVEIPLRALGESRDSVMKRLGEPSSIAVTEVANQHEPKNVDRIHTLNYKGLSVQVYEVTANQKELLLSVRMTTNQHGVLPEVIGLPESDVLARFGRPSAVHDGDWRFKTSYQDTAGEDMVTLHFMGSAVESAVWSFYLD